MRILLAISIILLPIFMNAQDAPRKKSFHDFAAETIDGKKLSMSEFKGKKVLVVNTASECGYTPQYKDLEELYRKYSDKGFVIIGFPSNEFGQQEPGSNKEIAAFCQKNYGVTFPMMAKISVKGENAHPLYKWLTSKEENGVTDAPVKWNFQKFLINEEGMLVEVLSSKESPLCEKVVNWINTGRIGN